MAKAAGGTAALGVRIVLLCALAALVTAAIGAAAAVLFAMPRQERPAARVVERGFSAHTTFQQERLQRLELAARLLAGELAARLRDGGEGDPVLAAAMTPEWDGTGAEEIVARLRQSLPRLGGDVALLLRFDGALVARSDSPAASPSLERPPLAPIASGAGGPLGETLSGVWEDEGRLYYAARAPLAPDFTLAGWAVIGIAVDDVVALEIERSGGADAAFFAATKVGPQLAGTSDRSVADRLGSQVGGLGGPGGELEQVLAGGGPVPAVEVTAGGSLYQTLVAPLADAVGEPVGAVVLFAPASDGGAAAAAAGVRMLLVGLAAGLLVALLICAPPAFAIARSTGAAAGRLTAAAEAARAGELPQTIGKVRGPLGGLAAALDRLFSDLHEQQALAAVATAAARGGGEKSAAADEAEEERPVLLAADLRRYAGPGGSTAADETVDRLRRDLRRFAAAASAHGGRFEGALGHRALASFTGEGRASRALAAAAEAYTGLAARDSAFDEGEPPALALAGGKVASGTATLSDGVRRVTAGMALGLIDSLLREAQPGEMVLAPPLARELGDELTAAGAPASERGGMFAPRPLAVLGAPALEKLAGSKPEAPVTGGPDPDATRHEKTMREAAPRAAAEAGGAAADPAALGPGDTLGERFEVLRVLATSAEGALVQARDRELGEVVAVEVLAPGKVARPEVFARLDSPLQAVRKLSHPGIARTYDYGRADGLPFLAREHVPGTPLERLLGSPGRLTPPAALGLARQLAAALAEAHGEGLAHGRLTADRLVLGADGKLRITGFGLAGVLPPPKPLATPGPLPPEGSGGPRGDVYSAAAILHRLLLGAWPEPDAQPPADNLPEGLAPLLAAALSREPAKRPDDGAALAAALDSIRV